MSAARTIRWALLAAVLLAACDSPTGIGPGAQGVVILRADGSEAARFVAGGGSSGALSVDVGETAIFTVRVIDDDGFTLPIGGSEFSIRNAGVLIPAHAGIVIQSPDLVVIEGLAGGVTSIRFQLWRGQQEEFFVDGVRLEVSA